MTAPFAQIAEAQFRLRQANARKAVAAGTIDLARAEAAMRPWAALAKWFGAPIPELAGHVSIDICPRDRTVAVLAQARDQALDRADYDAAGPLTALATEFRCPPYVPPSLREAKEAA